MPIDDQKAAAMAEAFEQLRKQIFAAYEEAFQTHPLRTISQKAFQAVYVGALADVAAEIAVDIAMPPQLLHDMTDASYRQIEERAPRFG